MEELINLHPQQHDVELEDLMKVSAANSKSSPNKNEPFTIGVLSSGHIENSDYIHHKRRSIKQI